jgi:hypothetical protein
LHRGRSETRNAFAVVVNKTHQIAGGKDVGVTGNCEGRLHLDTTASVAGAVKTPGER